VAGRALAFSDDAIVRMASNDFVPVAADDWYQRRRDDAEGKFFRKVADQGPRKGKGGSTRQGIYILTADGKLLTYKNSQDAGVMREVLEKGLKEWRKLPADRRKPGAVKVGDLSKPDSRYSRTPPRGGLILNVYTRILDKDGDTYCKGTCKFEGGAASARDHLWLTADEWKSLVPARPRKGETFAVPDRIAERILRFHLVDNTRGEPSHWARDQVLSRRLNLTVEDVTDGRLRLRLEGAALLATKADPFKAERGFDARLQGHLAYDRQKKAFTRIDILAIGDHWGRSTYTPGNRPGRKPLGVAFELATGDKHADGVPPQGARELANYFGRNR
jgi:hypothetical protein